MMNYKQVRERQANRLPRKQKTQKTLLDLVKKMKQNAVDEFVIYDDATPELEAPWTQMVHNQNPSR